MWHRALLVCLVVWSLSGAFCNGHVVKIGFLNPPCRRRAGFLTSRSAVRLAVADVNENAGLLPTATLSLVEKAGESDFEMLKGDR